jgi:5-methylcytosine-specific restriction endonuclease McrA
VSLASKTCKKGLHAYEPADSANKRGCPECERARRRATAARIKADPVRAERHKAMMRKVMRARYWADPQAQIAKKKAWYQKNRERELAKLRELYASDPEPLRARARARRARDPESFTTAGRKWREQNPNYRHPDATSWKSAWKKRNPEKVRAYEHRRKARLRDACSPGVTPQEWAAICDRHRATNGDVVCAYCQTNLATEIDHVVPIARGGRDAPDNVLPACRGCNASKGAKLLSEWMKLLERRRAAISP